MPVITSCEICGEQVKSKPSYIKKYCSKKCVGVANAKRMDNNLTNECEVCGVHFKVKPSEQERRKTCSVKCMGLHRKKTTTPKLY